MINAQINLRKDVMTCASERQVFKSFDNETRLPRIESNDIYFTFFSLSLFFREIERHINNNNSKVKQDAKRRPYFLV